MRRRRRWPERRLPGWSSHCALLYVSVALVDGPGCSVPRAMVNVPLPKLITSRIWFSAVFHVKRISRVPSQRAFVLHLTVAVVPDCVTDGASQMLSLPSSL